MDFSLIRAARVVAFKDSQPFRQRVFGYLAAHNRPVRAALWLYERLGSGWISTLMIAAYGARSFVGVALPRGRHALLGVAAYRNEARQLAWLEDVLGERIGRIEIGLGTLIRPGGWLALLRGLFRWRLVRFYLGQVHRINRRGDFLVAARVASTLAFYLRLRAPVAASGARAVTVSSDSNPYAMALSFAARSAGLRSIYITHGHIPEGPPRAVFDLSLLDGPACADVYGRSEGLEGDLVFKGAEGELRPLDTSGVARSRPVIGVFVSLITDWPALAGLVRRIRAALEPEVIVLRLHPNKAVRDPDGLASVRDIEGVDVSDGDRVLLDDAGRCDLVVAGNSSCHLTVLRYGVPTVYVRGLDLVPHDFYRFLEDRVVPGVEEPEDLDLDAIAGFYADPGWADRFARYDAGYAGADTRTAVAEAVRSTL